jgi:hypothetical protein
MARFTTAQELEGVKAALVVVLGERDRYKAQLDSLRSAIEETAEEYQKAGRSTEDWKYGPQTRECFRKVADRLTAILDSLDPGAER